MKLHIRFPPEPDANSTRWFVRVTDVDRAHETVMLVYAPTARDAEARARLIVNLLLDHNHTTRVVFREEVSGG